MTDLLKKYSFCWGEATDEAFQELKETMVTALVLTIPNFQEEIVFLELIVRA